MIVQQPPIANNAPVFGQTDMASYPPGPSPPLGRPRSRSPQARDLYGTYPYGTYPGAVPYMNPPQPTIIMNQPAPTEMTWLAIFLSFFLDVIPRQLYLHLLLRFPSLYFSRVTRIFHDANMSMSEIKQMALEVANSNEAMNKELLYQGIFPQESATAPPSFINLRDSWQSFIDSLMREWKTLNIITVLLLSAILTILQIDAAAADPVSRYSALLSLVCAFMSLLYGCIYIIRFGSMRKTHKAAEWANESEKSSTSIFWNVWVMLAMPAVWLGWSMIFFIVCVMAFVWQTGTGTDAEAPTQTASEILAPRIVISAVLGLGFLYLILIGNTFRKYSDPMEQAWQERIRGWLNEKATAAYSQSHTNPHVAGDSRRRSSHHHGSYQPFSSQAHASSQPYPSFAPASNPSLFVPPTLRSPTTAPLSHPITPMSLTGTKSTENRTRAVDGGRDAHSPPAEMGNIAPPPLGWIPELPESSYIRLPPPISIRPGITTVDSDGGNRDSISPQEHEPERGSGESVSTYASIPEVPAPLMHAPQLPPGMTVPIHPGINFTRIEEMDHSGQNEGLEDSNGMLEIMQMKPDGVVKPGSQRIPEELSGREDFMRLWGGFSEAITKAWKRIEKPQVREDIYWPASQPAFREFLQMLEEWNQSLSQYGIFVVFAEHDQSLEASKPYDFSLYMGSTDGRSLVIHSEVGGGSLHQYWLVEYRGRGIHPPKITVIRSQAK
ncbi:hypothetical protein EST38_g4299 [Candolleomyces aberdarensis]|uniref:Uncharacterized protein n=1 Tax=Candolleomyces aberdarensis TaxID=2316362 RepID=A0A4Q2DMY9_9AGAR|nr:hypothetical protein EST38_g4299 [Candolleomyces aberdarensis]